MENPADSEEYENLHTMKRRVEEISRMCLTDWIDYGLPLSTTSDEACKLYDASLTQVVGWYDDPNFGGLENTFKKMLEADPNFVMGHVLANGAMLLGTYSLPTDDQTRLKVDEVIQMAGNQKLTDLEQKHVTALKFLVDGEIPLACDTWEEILIDNPLDMTAARFIGIGYFQRGEAVKMRDCHGRMKQFWKPNMPLYGYLNGMHAFGLEESNMYEEAVRVGKKALEINKSDIFSTHAIAHVLESQGKPGDGIRMLTDSENDWNMCNMLACHVYWHNSLFHIEMGNFDDALAVFDAELMKTFKAHPQLLFMADATSFLYRLRTEGVKVDDRWRDVYEICETFKNKHWNSFYDAHVLMGLLGAQDEKVSQEFMDSIKAFVRNQTGHGKKISENIVIPLCEAIVAHENGDSARAVDILFPIRYDVIKTGGSHAQRDVFNMFLIDAAIKSDKEEHKKIARCLISEREALKETSPLTKRMMERFLAKHDS